MNPKINKIIVYQIVKNRKHKVHIDELQRLLRSSKKNIKITNKQIANLLNVPITKVEHWFRTDSSFAIPDENLWLELKNILKIETDIFDKEILEFEYDLGKYEQSQRVYLTDGLCPTITTMGDIKILDMEGDINETLP